MDIPDVDLDIVDDLGSDRAEVCLLLYAVNVKPIRLVHTVITMSLLYLAGSVVDSLRSAQALLLGRLLDALILFWVDLALWPRSCEYVDIINLDTRRLVLDGLPGNGNR